MHEKDVAAVDYHYLLIYKNMDKTNTILPFYFATMVLYSKYKISDSCEVFHYHISCLLRSPGNNIWHYSNK